MTDTDDTTLLDTPLDTKYLFVTGGVMSGLGKGTTAASIGRLLIDAGLDVTAIKIDPYINVDAGTMSPVEHGEVYVLDDGGEVDLDLGNYERFLNENMDSDHNITTGTIYESVIDRERRGDYLGKTVQVIPHVTNEIKRQIRTVPDDHHDVCIVEIGGTVGDIEMVHFMRALKEFLHDHDDDTALAHVTLLPNSANGEQKTKPTQHSVKELHSLGIRPDLIVGRNDEPLRDAPRRKIALNANLPVDAVFSNPDVDNIYELPYYLHDTEGIDAFVADELGLADAVSLDAVSQSEWAHTVTTDPSTDTVSVAIVGKYDIDDAYMSIYEALTHTTFNTGIDVDWDYVPATLFEHRPDSLDEDDLGDPLPNNAHDTLAPYDAVIVPGGFGPRGTEGKIAAINYARESGTPFLGLCFGMQLAVIEYARSVKDLSGAHSTELADDPDHPVIAILPEQRDIDDKGGTMRLGAHTTSIDTDTLAFDLYGASATERHRHRYEVNPEYIDTLEDGTLTFSGQSGTRMEIAELDTDTHPFFFGTQFHPEFTSRPTDPNPAFVGLVTAAADTPR